MASDIMTAVWRAGDTEEAKAARAAAERDALDGAVRDHARLVYRVCYSVLRNHHDAEDATQETFLRVMRFKAKLAEAHDSRNWLARVAWRVAIDRRPKVADALNAALRSAPTGEVSSSGDPVEKLPSRQAGAEQILQSAEAHAAVERLIAALPAKLRDPLVLSSLEELAPPDVAEVLGISEAAVRSRVFRARQILRERLRVVLHGK